LIIDTGPGYRSDGPREGWNRYALEHADNYRAKGLDALTNGPEVRLARHRNAEGLDRAARGMLTQRDASVINSLPDVAVPALVVVGADDTPFLAATDYMAAKIPGARKVVIPGAGHAVNIDQPEAFNAAVGGFLRDNGL
jgi:pimeloyl-ACP methyl ester carboxylesterase